MLYRDFLYGRFHGEGRFTSSKGYSYEGTFSEGYAHGTGKIIITDSIFEAIFDKGVLQE